MTGEPLPFTKEPREACGVFGIYAPNQPVAELTYRGLLALQHRGQDAAGIAVSDGDTIKVIKNTGLVEEALNHGSVLSGFAPAEFASGHVRYSTSHTNPQEAIQGAQPMFGEARGVSFTLSQNGHTINAEELEREMEPDRHVTDGELITDLVANELSQGASLARSVAKACNRLNGAYSLVVMGKQELIGIRDPNGFRPLRIGQLKDGGLVLASELAALDIVRAEPVREVHPGELVRINAQGVRSFSPFDKSAIRSNLCAFEYIYFSRPDNDLMGENVEKVRFQCGQELANEAPIEADIVIGVPNSGISATHGFADVSKLPMKQGITKNQYVRRTFIETGQVAREDLVRMKHNVNKPIVDGMRVVVVDDSIVRTTTSQHIVEMLREAGASEIHLRIASPPYKWPCFYGMNTGNIDELVAASMNVEEIRQEIGADTLHYLSIEGLQRSLGQALGKVCMACMTGQYPTPVPELLTKQSSNRTN